MKTTIHAQVSKRLLKEMPRFFASFDHILGELMQNAHRARASVVKIEFDRVSRLLTLEDDGVGAPDPQVFLSAGDTGWDEKRITDPAGLGFFSLLNPGYVETVEVESKFDGTGEAPGAAWKISLTPRALEGGEIDVCPSSKASCGTRVSITLTDRVAGFTIAGEYSDDAAADRRTTERLQKARAYFPMQVFFRGKELTPNTPDNVFAELETPLGRILLRDEMLCWGNSSPTLIWEFRALEYAHTFTNAMVEAVATDWERACAKIRFHWFISPKCGLLPKLPDRDRLIEGDSFKATARGIVEIVSRHILSLAQPALEGLPDTLTESEFSDILKEKSGLPNALANHLASDLLGHLGYQKCGTPDYANMELSYNSEDGMSVELEQDVVFSRSSDLIRSSVEHIAESLNLNGVHAAYDETFAEHRHIFRGLRYDEEHCPDIALCDGIEIVHPDGRHPPVPVKYLHLGDAAGGAAPEGWPRGHDSLPGNGAHTPRPRFPYLVYAGGALEFLRDLDTRREFWINLLFFNLRRDDNESDYWSGDEDGASILSDVLYKNIRSQIVAGYLPLYEKNLSSYHVCMDARSKLQEVNASLSEIKYILEDKLTDSVLISAKGQIADTRAALARVGRSLKGREKCLARYLSLNLGNGDPSKQKKINSTDPKKANAEVRKEG